MPKLADNQVPSYRRHKQSGQAIVTLNGKDILLGAFGTRESREEYNRSIAEWLSAGRQPPVDHALITVVEIMAGYWRFAKTYYLRQDGLSTGEVDRIARELSPLKRMYEIPFNRHFYVFKPPRDLATIDADLKVVIDRILTMIGGLSK